METGVIQSRSGLTFYTTEYFTSGLEAQRRLAMPERPSYRVGPIREELMPPFDAAPDRAADPAFGLRGGGHECATTHPLELDETGVPVDLLEV